MSRFQHILYKNFFTHILYSNNAKIITYFSLNETVTFEDCTDLTQSHSVPSELCYSDVTEQGKQYSVLTLPQQCDRAGQIVLDILVGVSYVCLLIAGNGLLAVCPESYYYYLC